MSNNYNLKFRDLLLVLVSEIETIKHLFSEEKDFHHLINELSNYDINDNSPLPSQKELLESLEINRSKLMGLLQSLYNEFRVKISHYYPIRVTEVHVTGEQRNGEYFQLSLNRIKHIPSVGDHIRLPLIRNDYGNTGYFQVKKVSHTFEESKHSILVFVDENITMEEH